MSSSLKEEFLLSSITLNYPELSCFHNSQWGYPSWVYPLWKLFWCIWHVTWLIVSGVRTQNTAPDGEDGAKWFVYASNWTFLLTTFFCLVDFAAVISNAWRRSRECNNDHSIERPDRPVPDDKEEILFQGEFTLVEGIKTQCVPCSTKFQWCLFESVNCANLLTTIAFWASQYEDGDYIHADIVVFNVINTVFVTANIMITGMPVRILHVIYPAIYIAIYFLFNLIYYLADGTAIGGSHTVFKPLEWDEVYPTVFTIVAGFVLFIPLGHLFFFSLFTLRIYLAEKFGNSESEPPYNSTYRKRDSTTKIEDGGVNRNHSHVNKGFEMDVGSRR